MPNTETRNYTDEREFSGWRDKKLRTYSSEYFNITDGNCASKGYEYVLKPKLCDKEVSEKGLDMGLYFWSGTDITTVDSTPYGCSYKDDNFNTEEYAIVRSRNSSHPNYWTLVMKDYLNAYINFDVGSNALCSTDNPCFCVTYTKKPENETDACPREDFYERRKVTEYPCQVSWVYSVKSVIFFTEQEKR